MKKLLSVLLLFCLLYPCFSLDSSLLQENLTKQFNNIETNFQLLDRQILNLQLKLIEADKQSQTLETQLASAKQLAQNQAEQLTNLNNSLNNLEKQYKKSITKRNIIIISISALSVGTITYLIIKK